MMSMRGTKRATIVRDGEQPSTSTAGPSTSLSKRRRTDPDDPLWQLRPVSDLKMSSIYNRSASEAPAELFRKDLISAMKLPDNEPLTSSEYWVITDPWKQDWERGVQVPVNPDSLPAPKVKIIDNPQPPGHTEFKLPKDKYIHLSRDAHYSPEKHLLSSTPACVEAACAYDLDATDTCWLKLLNAERARAGASAVTENQFEKVIEELEVRTWDKIQAIMKSEEGLGIEYDENVICDVCRSPDSEDGNEMVFCDSCNICVHQACYGITVIPDGQWLCRPCGDGVRPTCVLCPNQGGAMKCTPSGHKWAHVSCVLWIPEVSIGCAEKMEPITKISSIPPSRWSLVCVLCRERKGACIQCSVKSCKTAYHVTCAFKHGLEMRAIIEDENADDGVKLRSYCQKHSVNSKKEKSGSGSEEEEVKRKRRKDMTSEEKTQARAARLHEIEKEFDKHVSVKDISSHLLDVDQDAINYIYNYWKLKRRSGHNRPLLPPKSDDNELLSHRQEQADLDKMKMFVQLRQDLERVRNLCYMVSRREKLSRSFFRLREQTFHKQMAVLSGGDTIPEEELAAIYEANHGPSIYDTLYSHPDVSDRKIDFDDLLAKIAPPDSNDDKKKDRNGLRRSKSSNPYRKHYVNGSRRSGSMYSGLSSEESDAEIARSSKYRARAIGSTTEDEDNRKKPSTSSPKKKISPKPKTVKRSPKKIDKKKKKVPQSKAVVESSSEDDSVIARPKREKTASKTLRQMEKEMTAGKRGQSGSDSDELMPIRSTRSTKFPMDIYSDSSEDSANDKAEIKKDADRAKYDKDDKYKSEKSPNANDPQQSLPRTKAAMKEFVPSHSEKKESVSTEDKPTPKKRGRKPSNKEKKPPVKIQESDDEAKNKENKFSKPKDNPTDLIVPQRQAAKKASENMRSTSTGKKEENAIEKSPEEVKIKAKGKGKGKEIKSPPAKLTRQTSKDADKETIAYVPQRQAAKKAAAHIKNIGSKVPAPETGDPSKKKDEKQDSPKSSDESPTKKKVEIKESSSSSSGSSSSSYSSSSSSEYDEPEKTGPKPATKAREIKPTAAAKPPSLFSPPSARPTVDLPFLDKVSKPLSSTSASSDSDSQSDGSGSSSPTPKRPRRRRKHAIDSVSPRKAPDTKLKTSERESERGVSPSAFEREEPAGAAGAAARAATRARTRSTATSGGLPELLSTGSRKSSKDDSTSAVTPDKTPKESRQSGELPPPERKTHETVNESPKEAKRRSSPKSRRRSSAAIENSPDRSATHNDLKPKPSKLKRPSVSDDRDEKKTLERKSSPPPGKPSPKKNIEQRRKSITSRRMSIKEPSQKDTKDQVVPNAEEVIEPIKQRRQSRYETRDTKTAHESVSPSKKIVSDKPQAEVPDKKTPIQINEDYNDSEKWLPKAPSPTHVLTPIERPGGNEKYMTDDKSFDSADVCTEKSSVKMIAKIQANLNENTMIKSPRTPMDARSLAPEEDNPVKNLRKRSTLDAVTQQDASHVQGVEISKSAKIPSNYHDRPPTSPQQKDNELFAFDILDVDDGFNHDEIIKPFSSFPEFFFKEDSKEQGRQETLNLVDRLRMQLSAKKVPENCQQEQPTDDKEPAGEEHRPEDYKGDDYREDYREDHRDAHKVEDHRMQEMNALSVERNKHDGELSPAIEIRHEMEANMVSSPQQHHNAMNHIQHSIAPAEMPRRKSFLDDKEYRPMAMTSNDKWHTNTGVTIGDSLQDHESRKYEHNTYSEEAKDIGATAVCEVQSMSEMGDTASLSKQSDDSQPSAVDNSNGTIDVETIRERSHTHSYDEGLRGDCGDVSSPYPSHESQWRESEIPRRRSSASSTDSEASNARDSHATAGGMPEIDSYPPIPAYSCPVEPSMPLNQYATYPPDASPFLTTMTSLFGGSTCSQLPLPSPGPLYPPQLPYSATSLLPPKPPYGRLCAAFTSSRQNMALTTAMIAPPTPKPLDSPSRDDNIDVTPSDKFSLRGSSPSICVDESTYDTSQSRITKISNDSNETVTSMSQQECKSPAKLIPPLKAPIKFPGKSPGKSPGISPKRTEGTKGSKRSSNRSSRGNRGRGRSKSRGHGSHQYPPVDYLGDSIRNKLVGTVYDFEEEMANDGVDLKALRERRKSIDVRDDRRSEHSYKDTSQSPRSPQRTSKKTPTGEINDYRGGGTEEPEKAADSGGEIRGFVHVPPLLPGPVDMRTYQPEPAPAGDYLRPALAYSAAAAERHLADLEEETAPPPAPPAPPPPAPPPLEPYVPLPKVSLSDSRNQLKVKIKGPFLDANYSASSAAPPAPPPVQPLEPPVGAFTAAVVASSAMAGSTNLRRMRKKELLRQYWTQDMNMDDPTSGALMGPAPPPAAPPPPRAVITIPKAVASMTSIPTREDYKILEPPIVETKKKRKVSSGLSRELRHLKVTMNDEAEPGDEVKLSSLAAAGAHKRRARLSAKPAKPTPTSPLAPKLKIKIGADTVPHVSEEPSDFRPPKKRLVHKPSLEDLRRESMKYRKMVMADFEENEKTTKHKSSKSEKRKKKKDKKADKLQVVNSESESAPKLIIKIKRPATKGGEGGPTAAAAASAASEAAVDPFDYDPSAPDPLALDTPSYSEGLSSMRKVRAAKVTPIRLKLARTQGSSYVMKGGASPSSSAAPAGCASDAPPRPRTSGDTRGPARAHILDSLNTTL